jgi:hypothetical protein
MPSKYSVSQLCSHLNFEQVRSASTHFQFTSVYEPNARIDVRDAIYTYFNSNDTDRNRIETVSEITGTAIPLMFMYYLHGSIESVTRGVCDRIIKNARLTREYRALDIEGKRREHLSDILDNVPDFLKQANMYNAAISGYVHKVNQINNYSWMTADQAKNAIERLGSRVSEQAKFENRCMRIGSCRIEPAAGGLPYNANYEITGITDCEEADIMWEFKFTDTLQAEHEIQTALYALLTECRFSSYRLFNVKTGEIRELHAPQMDELEKLAQSLLSIKVSDTPAVSEVEFFRNTILPERPDAPVDAPGPSSAIGVPRQEDLDEFCDL